MPKKDNNANNSNNENNTNNGNNNNNNNNTNPNGDIVFDYDAEHNIENADILNLNDIFDFDAASENNKSENDSEAQDNANNDEQPPKDANTHGRETIQFYDDEFNINNIKIDHLDDEIDEAYTAENNDQPVNEEQIQTVNVNPSETEKEEIPEVKNEAQPENPPVYFDTDKVGSPYHYEYPQNLMDKAPLYILNSNDTTKIRRFALDHKTEDKPLAMHFVYRHKGLTALKKREESAKTVIDGKLSKMEAQGPVVDGDTVMLDVAQESYQNTYNGCWSVAYANLMRSRGVNVDQKAIRTYRPGTSHLKNENEIAGYENEMGPQEFAHVFNEDEGHDIFESGELVTKLVPNTGLHTRDFGEIKAYLPIVSEVNGVKVPTIPTKETDEARYNGYMKVLNGMKETIREGIEVNKSPVALTNGYHYLTIVGTGKDEQGREGFYYKDSLRHNNIEKPEENTPNKTWFMTYEDYLNDVAIRNYGTQNNPDQVSKFGLNFSWVEDYSLDHPEKLNEIGLKLNGNDVELDKPQNEKFKNGNWETFTTNLGSGDFNKDAFVVNRDDGGLYNETIIVPKTLVQGEPVKKNEMDDMVRRVKEAENRREEEKKARKEAKKKSKKAQNQPAKNEQEDNIDKEYEEFNKQLEEEIKKLDESMPDDDLSKLPAPSDLGPSDLGPSDLGPSDLGPSDLGPSDKKPEPKKDNTPAIDREVIFKSAQYREYITELMSSLVQDPDMKLFNPTTKKDEKAFDARCDKATWGEALKEAKVHLQTIAKCYDIYADEEKRNQVNLEKLDKTINESLKGLKSSVNEYLRYTSESIRGEKNNIAQKMNTAVNHIISRREAVGGNAEQRYESLANATEGLYDFTKRLSREESDNIFSRNSDEFKNMLKAARDLRDKVRPNFMSKRDNTVNMAYLKSAAFEADLDKVKKLAEKYKNEKKKDNKEKRTTRKGQIRYEAADQLAKFCDELKKDAQRAKKDEYTKKQFKIGKWEKKNNNPDEIDNIIEERENKVERCYLRGRYERPERADIKIKTRVTVDELEDKKTPVNKKNEKSQPEKSRPEKKAAKKKTGSIADLFKKAKQNKNKNVNNTEPKKGAKQDKNTKREESTYPEIANSISTKTKEKKKKPAKKTIELS
ncbi:MAG: hypothetical protein IKR70_05030 [Lachnospiraceae bacterium]|nr:hypothetical protein [Lachnospiraceae bacterium]